LYKASVRSLPGGVRDDYDSEGRGGTRAGLFSGNVEAVPLGCQGTRAKIRWSTPGTPAMSVMVAI